MEKLDEYQDRCADTANYPGIGKFDGLLYTVLGLAGEAGELANKLKKVMRDDSLIVTDERKQQLIDELGDIMWYVARVAYELGVPMSTVASRNIEKLASRKRRGVIGGSGDTR